MQNFHMILASASPRRKELLLQGGYTFDIIPAKGEEHITSDKPFEVVKELSMQKASEVMREQSLTFSFERPLVVIGSDTVVAHDDTILGKPSSREDAIATLRLLSGNTHQVYTGVTILYQKDACSDILSDCFYEKTDVTFYPLDEQEITCYVDSGDPFDKAGSYGIQGPFAIHVKEISGDYNNVVGLPLAAIYRRLKKFM